MNKNKNKSGSNCKFDIIKELMGTPRGKGILFFLVYFIFFFVLTIVARSSTPVDPKTREYEKGNPYRFSIQNIVDKNYHFEYEINIDDKIITYKGNRYNNIELFQMSDGINSVDYYRDRDNYLSKNNQLWLKAVNPYKYYQFMDIENVSNILLKATYVSKTKYESGKEAYNFLVSSATLVELLEGGTLDIEEVPNEVVLFTDDSGYTERIVFGLNSYCLVKGICTLKMSITLKYDNYGKVEAINSPI